MDGIGGSPQPSSAANGKYDRSRLLPTNRRLRHLHGLSLRNLSVPPLFTNAQTKRPDTVATADYSHSDEALSPSSRGGQEHQSDCLSNASDVPTTTSPSSSGQLRGADPESPFHRPSLERARRRRSTLNWAGKSPQARQQKLEDLTSSRMADTWFSLHCEGFEEPVYLSEVVPLAMNPDYRFFDISTAGPLITRLNSATVKIWAKTSSMRNYELLLVAPLSLPSLHFIGKTMEELERPLAPNSLLVYLSDGIYATLSVPADHGHLYPPAPDGARTPVGNEMRPTSSYDALMQLASLDDCIQDALMTQQRIADQINDILRRSATSQEEAGLDAYGDLNGAGSGATVAGGALDSAKREPLLSIRRYVMAEKKQLRAMREQRAEMAESLQRRKDAMAEGRRLQQRGEEELVNIQAKLRDCKEQTRRCREGLQVERRRVCEDLSRIYPVEPVPQRCLHFTVRGLPLGRPLLDAKDEDPATLAAALGYVAHAVQLLARYLGAPLPYALAPQLSTSRVRDDVSLMLGQADQRAFPLFLQSGLQYRLEYAVYLLNKDIECLVSRRGLKVLDLRQTLGNLKYLLYAVCAADAEAAAGATVAEAGAGAAPASVGVARAPSKGYGYRALLAL